MSPAGGAPSPQGQVSRLLRARADAQFSVLGDDEYRAIRRLLSESAGMVYDEKRREVLRLHLRDRAIATGCDTFADYVGLATSSPDELQALWNQVAIHQTEFFRNRPQFEGLRSVVLPEVIRVAREAGRRLTVWSAGCSSGEEPYSLAIVLLEALGDEAAQWQLEVVATDISTEILARAESGIYDERHVEGVSDEIRNKWFERRGDSYAVAQTVRELVKFSTHNLSCEMPPSAVAGRADIVFCCNVTIYFSKDALHRSIGILEAALRPGGYVFLGHSESLWRQPHHLELVDLGSSFVYRMPYLSVAAGPVLPAATARSFPMPDVKQPGEQLYTGTREMAAEFEASPVVAPVPAGGPRTERKEPSAGAKPIPQRAGDAGEEFESAEEEIATLRASDAPLEHGELAEIVATAQGHLERGQVEEVIDLVGAALRRAPTEGALHFLLGSTDQRLGRHSEALASFGRAVYCDDSFSLAYFYRAMLLEVEGDSGQALLEFRNALRRLEADPAGKWDGYLEAMSHDALVQLCEGKIASLEGGGN